MPSKHGFGNSRAPMTKKVSYGSAMHYKNPVKKKIELPINESDNTRVDQTSANITIDAVERQEKNDKYRRSTQTRPSTKASSYDKTRFGTTDDMFANDPNRKNSYVNEFFKR
tara:strand:- start:232 stop:567 length:336 start_codon:yes stop_codon:yes gene_type:complete